MTIKKITRLLLVITALTLVLSACSQQKTQGDDNKPCEATAVPAATGSETEKPVVTDAPVTDVPATDAPTEEPATEVPTELTDPTEAPSPAPVESGTNVALGAEVDVSTTTGESHQSIGFSPEAINDGYYYDPGVPSAGWTTNVGENYDDPEQEEWAVIKLAQDTSINKIKVYPVVNGGRFPISFKLMVSLDGKEYTTVAEVTDNTRFEDKDDTPFEFEFDAVTCRYVQFLATHLCDPSPADGYLCQVAEIEIYAA
ncbi:MAG: discoidin domain-containing protein [Clostridia bacterium]|nr:discoidin domain-containing protein [Clostridia bacterium]